MTSKRVNIVHVVVNEHGPIFDDLIELLTDVLQQAGVEVSRSTNQLIKGMPNLLVGHTFVLTREDFAAIRNTGVPHIVFQMEALDDVHGFNRRIPHYVDFLLASEHVWDYSLTNVAFLKERGCSGARHVPIGYSGRLERVVHGEAKDMDVLFYGSMSDRRRRILDRFQSRGARVARLFRAYGPERDRMIGRAKVVLNLHQFDLPQLEEVRISFLLNNRCFVLSESSDHNPYGEGVAFCDYDKIVDCGMSYLRPGMETERARIAAAGFRAIKEIPTIQSVQSALEAL